jgi:pyruvate/2-oxoglutarate dehydrogenase complex dihydrolipoamide dehydrogenase (E3) component
MYADWIAWLTSQVVAMGVDVRTKTHVSEEMLNRRRPDAVILATGAEKVIPPIPGIELPLVCSAFQILSGEVEPGKNIVIIGGGMIGMETADFILAEGEGGCPKNYGPELVEGRRFGTVPGARPNVTVVELLPRSPVKKFAAHGYMLHKRLRDAGGRLLLGTKVERILKDSVVVSSEQQGEETLPADQVAIAVGTRSRNELKPILEKMNIRHFVVGDAVQPRRIIEATEEGARAAWNL